MRPFDDPGTLHFGEYTNEREHRSPDRGREIERLTQRYEANTEMLELVDPAATVTVGPSSSGNIIRAISP